MSSFLRCRQAGEPRVKSARDSSCGQGLAQRLGQRHWAFALRRYAHLGQGGAKGYLGCGIASLDLKTKGRSAQLRAADPNLDHLIPGHGGQKLDGQGLDGLKLEGGKIAIDGSYRTTLAKVWAGGDCRAAATQAAACAGFSGAEIEQVVVSALYAAQARQQSVDQALLLHNIQATAPLSVVMAEQITALRQWALERCVKA